MTETTTPETAPTATTTRQRLRAALAEFPRRTGFAQRAILLYFAFLRHLPVERLEASISETTYHTWHPLGAQVARQLRREGLLAEDFDDDGFVAWLGPLENRIRERQKRAKELARVA